MINIDFSNMPIGMTPVYNENTQLDDKFKDWKEADLILKELRKKYPDTEKSIIPSLQTPPDCVKMDEQIKEVSFEIEQLNKDTQVRDVLIANSKNPKEIRLYVLRNFLLELKQKFNNRSCSDILEAKKTEDNAKILTKESAKAEKKVLEKGFKEQYVYIGFGSVILLVALYIVTRNKK
jgi:hypothetical protein